MIQETSIKRFDGNERFQVLSTLGRGGMGVVYAVYDRKRQTKVALKTLNEGNPAELLRLKAEFRALQELDHPNFVSLGELFEENGIWFFTMELVEGVNFIKYIRAREPGTGGLFQGGEPDEFLMRMPILRQDRPLFDDLRLRQSLVQLFRALDALHATNRVHRDIKPENVIVQDDGRVVLLDFGLVTQSDPGQLSVAHYNPVGTAAYMAPEQAASQPVGPEADWYATGVLLFEALTGTQPFTGTFNQLLLAKHTQAAPHPRELNSAVPEDLGELCVALMQQDPSLRPRGQDAIQILQNGRPATDFFPSTPKTRMPVFIGRRRELDWLLAGAADIATTGLVTLLVHGASGLGKSEMLRTAGREMLALNPRTIILWGRCNERESLSYKAFDGVVDALSRFLIGLSETEIAQLLPRNADLLARVFPVLSFLRDVDTSGVGQARQSFELHEIRMQAFLALREILTRLADRRPVVVVIDDIQWADEDSFKLLRALMQPPDAPAVLFILSMRTPTDEADATDMVAKFHEQLLSRPRELRLGPLSVEASAELAMELLRGDLNLSGKEVEQVGMIAEEAAGHPLFIHELVHYYRESGPERTGGTFRLDDVLWNRIQTLDDDLRRLVELVSISFGPLRQEIAGIALGVKPEEVFRRAARLRVMHLARTSGPGEEDLVEPYHDRVRESVHARMSDDVKNAWHMKLAKVMKVSHHVEPERLAAHLEIIGERQQAAAFITEAADQATSALAFDRAAGLYEKAIRLRKMESGVVDPELIRTLNGRLGDALANAGRGKDAAHAMLEAVPGSRADDALELKQRAASQLLCSGYLDEGFEITRQVLQSIGIHMPRTSFGALVSLLWRRVLIRIRGLKYRERDETQISPSDLANIDVLDCVARGLGFTDHLRGADFNTRFLLAALRLGEPQRILAAMSLEANYAAGNSPNSDYLRRTLASCERIQERLHNPVTKAYIDSAHGYTNFMRGEWEIARIHAKAAAENLAEIGGLYWERGMVNFQWLWAQFYLGDLADMTRRMSSLLQNARERGDLFSVAGLVLGLNNVVLLNQYGSLRAEQEIDEILARWTVHGYHLQHYWALVSRVHICLYDGNWEKAHRFILRDWKKMERSFLTQIPSILFEGLYLRARVALLHAAHSDGQTRKKMLQRAKRDITRLNKGRLPWVLALGRLAKAGYLALTGEAPAAQGTLEEAIDRLDACQMRMYAAAARIRMGEFRGGNTGKLLMEQGHLYMASQGVTDEIRMINMLSPTFPAAES